MGDQNWTITLFFLMTFSHAFRETHILYRFFVERGANTRALSMFCHLTNLMNLIVGLIDRWGMVWLIHLCYVSTMKSVIYLRERRGGDRESASGTVLVASVRRAG